MSLVLRSQPKASSRARLEMVIMTMSATRASVAASAPALTHKARQEGGPPSSAAETLASSAIAGRIRHRRGRWNGREMAFGPFSRSVRRINPFRSAVEAPLRAGGMARVRAGPEWGHSKTTV